MGVTAKNADGNPFIYNTSATAKASEQTPRHCLVPDTTDGLDTATLISAATTNATSVKAEAGQIYEIWACNINAAARYLKLYNLGAPPTVGTSTVFRTYTLPPNVPVFIQMPLGIKMDTGIAFALTTGVAGTDTGAVAADEIVINIGYK